MTNHNFNLENQNDLLFQIINDLTKIDNPEHFLDIAITKTQALTNACSVSIALLDSDQTHLSIRAIVRDDGEREPNQIKYFKIGEGIAGLAAKNRQIVHVLDVAKSRHFIGTKESISYSIASIPMIYQNELVGVLSLGLNTTHVLNRKEKEFLGIVAATIAGTVKNSELYGQVKKENQLLNSLVSNVEEGITILDKNARVLVWNNYLENLSGIPAKEAIGKHLIETLQNTSFDTPLTLQEIMAHIKKDGRFYFETELVSRENKRFYFGVSFVAVMDLDKEINKIIITVRNISKERELIQAKNDLISTATHELRTPLTAVKGYLSMLLHGDAGELAKKQQAYVEKAAHSTERLVNLVEYLLSAFKIDENKISLSKEIFDISIPGAEAIENLLSKSTKKSIEISNNLPNNLLVLGDPEKTKHVFENIIDNAIKYSARKSKISISSKKQPDKIEIRIADQGIGINAEDADKVFDKFSRVQNKYSVAAGGTGLGLYIVKGIVEKQGGKIWLESDGKTGTTFVFSLPRP
jgi:PAS domain S-box-containing protein